MCSLKATMMTDYVQQVEDFCAENGALCSALMRQERKIVERFEQFPEALCDMATSLVFKDQFKDRLEWRAGLVVPKGSKGVPHFWIYDRQTGLNIDLTAFQFDHIAEFICDIGDQMQHPCPFIVASDEQLRALGYKTLSSERITKMMGMCPKRILLEARKQYKLHRRS
jgi:hypothetical protein